MIRRILLLLAGLCLSTPALAWQLPAMTTTAIGDQAYYDLIGRFWRGSATFGSLLNQSPPGIGSPDTLAKCPGCLWSRAHTINAFYAYWKATGSTDARNRITGYWNWINTRYQPSSLIVCGAVAGTSANVSDDAAWVTALYLQAYEASGDAAALTAAKGMLDCAWARWADGGTAGCTGSGIAVGAGLWYSDDCTSKSSYQNVLALDSYWYYQLSGDTTYRQRAIDLDTWIATYLYANGQTNQAQVYQNNGLYYVSMQANGTISGLNSTPSVGSSPFLMAGEMAESILCARLYADTGTASYLVRLQKTSQGMHSSYRDGSGVIVAMRDARVDGWGAYLYANEIINAGLLPSGGGLSSVDFKTTAQAVHDNARSSDMTYAGCWDGPSSNASCVWATSGGNYSQRVEMSANAANWPIAGLAVP